MGGRSPPPVREYPYLLPSLRNLMTDLLSTVEARLGSHLLTSAVPSDVLSFQNPSGTSAGAIDIRSGSPDSPIYFILESWLHCELPTGALNIATLLATLNTSTDAPHLICELIQSSPTSLLLFLDLFPRRDLVLHPDYLDEFYHQTNLEKPRQELAKLPQVQPYFFSSLYLRCLVSPTVNLVLINVGGSEGDSAMEDIIRGPVRSTCKEIVEIWLDKCANSRKQLGDAERADLITRDDMIISKSIEVDLVQNLPRMFGPDVADRVVREIQKAFRRQENNG
ncbi:hypothetical protein Cni_G21656 [Canna indica]|uniref:Red chlorophyll catabolite reductase n=1 Tax=Canna indica TaxID=4628 RepID=A0AAQ3KPX7_9LILI|nr:hypothetical protein Cni_G21656 [Canna indica]